MAEPVVWDLVAKDRYSRTYKDAERSTLRFRATLGKFSGFAVSAFGGVGVALAGVGIGAATLGLKTEAGLEQARIAFKHLLGGAKQADAFLKQLVKFAAETPFELPGIEQAAQLLLGAGEAANKILPDLRAIGDAASTSANPTDAFNRSVLALSQSMGKGKLQAEEIQQVVEAGIPMWRELSRATGLPVPKLQDMASKGKLLTKDILPKLFDQMHKDYGGAMAEQSTTLTGVWSTFKDTVSNSLAQVMTPLADMLKNVLPAAGKTFQTAIQNVADFITTTVKPAFAGQGGKGGLAGALQTVKDAAKAFADGFGGAQGVKARLDDAKASADTLKQSLDLLKVAFGDQAGLQQFSKTVGWVVGHAAEEFTGLVKQATGAIRTIAAGAAALTVVGDYVKLGVLVGQEWLANLEIGALKTFRSVAKFMDLVFHTHMADALRGAISSAEGWRASLTGKVDKAKTDINKKWANLRHALQSPINTNVTASLKLNFSKDYTRAEWVADRARAGRMAAGGLLRGPGGPKGDRIPIMASDQEFMQPADAVAYYGVPFMEAVRKRRLPRFASGGSVGQIPSQERAINKIEAHGTGMRFYAGLAAFIKAFGGGNIKAFIRAADARPYVWGGVGPGGFDCSGLTGEVYARMQHLPSYRRYFTTASNFGALGFAAGPGGMYTIGVDAGRGHMAGRYGGLAFEAANTRAGIRVGNAARSVSTFPAQYHMAKGGLVGELAGWLAEQPGIAIGGDPARLRIERYDRGGLLRPGATLMLNNTGRAEPVGFNYREMAKAIGDELRANPPRVAVDEIMAAGARLDRWTGGVTRR